MRYANVQYSIKPHWSTASSKKRNIGPTEAEVHSGISSSEDEIFDVTPKSGTNLHSMASATALKSPLKKVIITSLIALTIQGPNS